MRALLTVYPDFEVSGEADTGRSAIELVLTEHPDLLLLDFLLPDISGNEVLRRLRDQAATVATLMVTAAIDRAQTLEALRLGARGVVMKSSAADVLLKAIQAVLKGEYWVGHKMMADWASYAQQHGQPRQTLTAREQEIVTRVLNGDTNRDIAAALGVGEETVKTHVSNIYRKLGVSSRMELALYITSGKLAQPM